MHCTRTKVYLEPTSKLVYYKVFRDESPYSWKEIDSALSQRKYISFEKDSELDDESSVNKNEEWNPQMTHDTLDFGQRLKKTFNRRFIRLEDEERKISERGKGLANYAFDSNENLYATLLKILRYEDSYVRYFGFSSLTWSEFALFQYIAKQMARVLELRIRKLRNEMHSVLDKFSIDTLEDYMNMSSDENLTKIHVRLLDEEILKEYFQNLIRNNKKTCILDGLGKMPLNRSLIDEIMTFNNPSWAIARRLIPTSFAESLWDSTSINSSFKQETKLVLQNGEGVLKSSIQEQENLDINVPSGIKHLVLVPLKLGIH